jgi:hypothetical protein
VAFIPLALAIEQGGDMLQPMAAGAIGGLLMEVPVALFLMPCLYALSSRGPRPTSDPATVTTGLLDSKACSPNYGRAHR